METIFDQQLFGFELVANKKALKCEVAELIFCKCPKIEECGTNMKQCETIVQTIVSI